MVMQIYAHPETIQWEKKELDFVEYIECQIIYIHLLKTIV